jgi:hypothetical protein
VKKATLRGKLCHMNRRVCESDDSCDTGRCSIGAARARDAVQFADVHDKHRFRHFGAVKEPREAVLVTIEERGKFTGELR